MRDFFNDKGWNKTLMCVKMQVSKKTIDHKNAYYETLTDAEKQELEQNNWMTHFQDANSVFLDALRDYMGITKTTKSSNARGNNNAQIRATSSIPTRSCASSMTTWQTLASTKARPSMTGPGRTLP